MDYDLFVIGGGSGGGDQQDTLQKKVFKWYS